MIVHVGKTLGMAWLEGLQPHARCRRGSRIGPVKVDRCGYDAALDLETLLWTRGARFPCWRLSTRLRCPRCGTMSIEVAWLPGAPRGVRLARQLYQCEASRMEVQQQSER